MYEHCFNQLSPAIKARLSPPRVPLVGFSGERCWPIGEIDLDLTIGEPPLSRTETLDFVVVRSTSQHNILLGRVAMMKMVIITSTIHQLVKFYTPEGIGTLASTYDREKVIMAIRETEERPGECILETREEDLSEEKISINPLFPEQKVTIGGSLPMETKKKLPKLLQANIDIFAWEYGDMTGIPRTLSIDGTTFSTEHKLNEYRHLEPILQKKRNLASERDEAACKEVEELLQADIIREAKYPTWVANPVMVKKSDGGWRMCVDFTNINKAYPKDCYPLPEIAWKVESLIGYKYKCFLDAYKGYHQIQMAEEEEEKTSFFTSKGIYCYKKMPFGLKNAGATYQRLVDKISWTEEAEQAFVDMKAHIANLPTLTSPKPGETLYLYLATSKECISVVLVAEREKVQVPIYFVSRVLQGVEANYPELKKLTLALVHTARKLQRYLQAHPIIVLTNKQIRQVLMKPEKLGRVAKWAIELGEHDIDFQARHSIRAQVLADFIAETTETNEESDTTFAQIITPPVEIKEWKLFTDRASSSAGSGAGLMLINPEGQEFTYALHFEFNTTNNEAEYEALLAGLRIAKEMKIEHLQAFVDSQLVANQVLDIFEAK
ncbi:uncharacterized protein [Rutidosis leptorrhynchoides]|uniref:uncharacterized protein n=1 Tax=Rutidosis leptorrhynchoides TaxID=125765 RepID=UPI003A98E1A9